MAEPPLRKQLIELMKDVLPGYRHTPAGKRVEAKIMLYEAEEYGTALPVESTGIDLGGQDQLVERGTGASNVVNSPPSGSSDKTLVDVGPELKIDYGSPSSTRRKGKGKIVELDTVKEETDHGLGLASVGIGEESEQ